MSNAKVDCRKFSPNIFNKTKCGACFASKDSHSAEALDSNRETRRVSKCGYLFVAPDWDFSNPINRTKRWQRRWFVLYDDGELTYSVDEHPETVPQAIIDMTKVLEVSDAENVTGNQFSLAITAPEKVHFVKGTSREESRWWFDVLSIFPRSTKGNRHKRNATFPGGKATTINEPLDASKSKELRRSPSVSATTPRTRLGSCNTSVTGKSSSPITWPLPREKMMAGKELLPEKIVVVEKPAADVSQSNDSSEEIKTISVPKPKETPAAPKERSPTNTREHIRTRRILRREQRGLAGSRSMSDGISLMFPKQHVATDKALTIAESRRQLSPLVLLLSEEKSKFLDSGSTKDAIPTQQQYMNNKNLAITRHFSKSEKERLEGPCHTNRLSLDSSVPCCIPDLISAGEKDNISSSLPSSPISSSQTMQDIYIADHPVQVRGDPDGCGLDSFGHNVDDHVDVPLETIVYVKKGWLLKEDLKKEWQKQWFVLRGTSLMFYRDPDAEDSGSCEGLLDMNQVKRIEEAQVDRNYGFLLEVQDQEMVMLSAITNGLRNSWMQALCKAARLQEPVRDYVIPLGERIEKEMSLLKQLNNDTSASGQGDVPSSPRSGVSSDDEFKTASEASGRMEDYLELPEEDADPSSTSSSRALPPSPPLNRTPISRVKERARTRNTRVTTQSERVEKRHNHRSSRQTNDDFAKDLVCGGSDHEMDGPGSRLSASDSRDSSRKVGKSVASDVPEAMLVGLLELEVESLKAQLQDAQNQLKHRCNQDYSVDGKHASYSEHAHVLKPDPLPVDTDFDCPLSSWRQRMVMLEAEVADLTKLLAEKNKEVSEKSDQLKKLEDGQLRHGDLLQRYHSLRNRLQQLETLATTSEREKALQAAYEQLESRYLGEKASWEDQSANLKAQVERSGRSEIVEQLEARLEASEKKILALVTEMEDLCRVREKRVGVLHAEMQQREIENQQLRNKIQQDTHTQHSDVKHLEALLSEAMATVKERDMTVQQCQSDVITLKAALDKTSGELVDVVDKLQKANAENETLRSRASVSNSKVSCSEFPGQGSTSELQSRLDKATQEIQVLKRTVKSSHDASDELELRCHQLKQLLKNTEEDFKSQLHLMTVRVEDLTLKLSNSEKTNRQLKQKMSRSENKEQRRTRSLKGKEALTISKELELKVGELERKLCVVERGIEPKPEQESLLSERTSVSSQHPDSAVTIQVNDNPEASGTPAYKLEDSLKLLARINTLESKVDGAAQKLSQVVQLTEKSTPALPGASKHKGQTDGVVFSAQSEEISELPMPESKDSDALADHCVALADWVSKRCTCSQHANWALLGNKFSAFRSSRSSGAKTSVKSRLRALKDLQQQKDEFLTTKRTVLGQLGLLAKETNVSIAADKLVHQSFLVSQMAHLVRSSNSPALLVERVREIKNICCRWVLLINALKRKAKQAKMSSITNFDRLLNMPSFGDRSSGVDFYAEMLKYEDESRRQINLFKSTRTQYLASVLARKTLTEHPALTLSQTSVSKPATDLTPDPLTQKLMETEMKRVVSRLQNIYEQDVRLELQTCSHLLHCPPTMADERTNIVLNRLERDMGLMLEELRESYRSCLSQIEFEKKLCLGEEVSKSEVMVQLAEYASMIAQHAILTGHTDYLRNNFFPPDTSGDKTLVDEEEQVLFDEVLCQELDLLHSTELSVRMLQSIGSDELFAVKGLQVGRWTSAQDILNTSADGKPSYFLRSYEARAQRSFRQRGQRSVTMPICSMVDATTSSSPSSDAKKATCSDCAQSQLQIKAMREKHKQELALAKEQLQEVEKKWKAELDALELEHSTTISRLQEKLVNVERKRVSVRTECEQQIAALRETYGQEIAKKNDAKFNDESIRQRYQAEIEQLRGLCEKGLVAMENSHRRIVAELEEKHRQELEQLQAEKEQALAEETKATLAALDAMRKAHEAELQREIAKFKQEFFQKMQSSHEVTAHKEQDREELESIKHEIISLSNKYAQKCVEKASLEEHVQPLARQLSEANSLIFDLTARNKQLRSRLKSSNLELQSYLDEELEDDALQLKLQLQMKESELMEKQEIICDLEQQLHSAHEVQGITNENEPIAAAKSPNLNPDVSQEPQ